MGLKGYSVSRKTELIQKIENHRRSILDEPVPEIKVPILEPVQFTAKNNIGSLKSLAGNISSSIFKKINKFVDWLISYIPEPVRNSTSEKLNQLKDDVKQIFENLENFKIEEIEPSLKGFLKTYRING